MGIGLLRQASQRIVWPIIVYNIFKLMRVREEDLNSVTAKGATGRIEHLGESN